MRTAELTVMMMQLVASRRGVAALPNWALMENAEHGYMVVRPIGEHGMWGTLYAATHATDRPLAFMTDFLHIAHHHPCRSLKGVRRPACAHG